MTTEKWTLDGRGDVDQQLPIRKDGKIVAAIRDEGSLNDGRRIVAAMNGTDARAEALEGALRRLLVDNTGWIDDAADQAKNPGECPESEALCDAIEHARTVLDSAGPVADGPDDIDTAGVSAAERTELLNRDLRVAGR